MGGKSSSSSSSSSVTEQYDSRVAVESQGIGIGSGATVNITDGGILEGAGELAKSFNATLQSGFGTLDGIVKESFSFAERIVADNNAILAESTEADSKEIAQTLIWVGGAALAILTFGLFWRKR